MRDHHRHIVLNERTHQRPECPHVNDMNLRIEDVNTNVTTRIDDVHVRIDELRDDIRELRALAIDVIHSSTVPTVSTGATEPARG